MLSQAPVSPVKLPRIAVRPLSGSVHHVPILFSYCRVTRVEICVVIVVSLIPRIRRVQLSPVGGFVTLTLKGVGVDVPWIVVAGRFVLTVGFGWTE